VRWKNRQSPAVGAASAASRNSRSGGLVARGNDQFLPLLLAPRACRCPASLVQHPASRSRRVFLSHGFAASRGDADHITSKGFAPDKAVDAGIRTVGTGGVDAGGRRRILVGGALAGIGRDADMVARSGVAPDEALGAGIGAVGKRDGNRCNRETGGNEGDG